MRTLGRWLATALPIVAACGGAQADVDRALQRMYDQPRAHAYGPSGAFATGAVMRPPPAGTVAREDVLDSALGLGLGSGGMPLDRIPVPVTPALLARGRDRFAIVCAACHGVGGFGGSVVAANWMPRRPPSLRGGAAVLLPPGAIYRIVTGGIGRMPSYAAELPVTDRWAIVAFVETLRHRPPADSLERDDSSRAERLRVLDSTLADTAR